MTGFRPNRHRHDHPAITGNCTAHNALIVGLGQLSVGTQISEASGRRATQPSYHEVDYSGSSTEIESDSEADAQEQDYYWHHFYQGQRLQIQQQSTEAFRRLCTGVRYTAPPEGRLPHRNWTRTLHREPSIIQTEEERGADDAELVVISYQYHLQRYFHFACPFYTHAPKRHKRCLRNSLQSIESVIDHLIHSHSRSPYCPICYKKFNTLIERDNHILNETCKKRDADPSDGLGEDQKVMLIHENDSHLDDKQRWHRISGVIFPDPRQPFSPYLDEGCGLAASMANDFWDLYGHQIIGDFLNHQGLTAEESDDAHAVLYDLALYDLLDGVIGEYTD